MKQVKDVEVRLIYAMRVIRKRIRNAGSDGQNADALRNAFHMLVQVLDKAMCDEIPSERLAELNTVLDRFVQDGKPYGHWDGGAGSGNWGHEGRPGKRGGSAGGGGVHNRMTAEGGSFTSFSKMQKEYAKPHSFEPSASKQVSWKQKGTKLISGGTAYVYHPKTDTFEGPDHSFHSSESFKGKEVKILVPNSASPNYSKVKSARNSDLSIEAGKKKFAAAFNPSSAKEADDVYRAQSGKVWTSISKDAQSALVSYTGSGYINMNAALRKGEANSAYTQKKIEHITDAISRSTLAQDSIFHRGVSASAFEKVFKLKSGELTPEAVGKLVGREGTDEGFMSTGSAKGQGFPKKVRMEILAPKGTQALYVEPFSALGNGSTHWDSARVDGKSKQTYFSHEDETIIQQGSSMKILSAKHENGKYHFQVMVTEQNPVKIGVASSG